MTEVDRQSVVVAARALLGAPWRHRGRTPRGVDCLGLIVLAQRAGGHAVRDRRDYPLRVTVGALREPLRDHLGRPLSAAAPEYWGAGDVALLEIPRLRLPHAGVLAPGRGGWRLIHAHSRYGVAEHDLRGPWQRMLLEVYPCRR